MAAPRAETWLGSVASSEVAADSLTAGDLAAGSVGSSEVAADSLGAGDLAAGSVGTSEVANNSLTGSDIVEASLGSVGSANFAGDSALLDGSDSSEFLSTTLRRNREWLSSPEHRGRR